MSYGRWPVVSRVLDEVLERPPEEWGAIVDRLCAGDDDLRREVNALLAGHDHMGGFLDAPPRALLAEALERGDDAAVREGWTVGPYRVVRQIGRGGMGRVMLAERTDGEAPRSVALKLLRPGTESPDVRWRFRTEQRILATLDHPHIAHLFDGGVTDDGQPWLAMEYVEGLPIDRYAQTHSLDVPRRLGIFLSVAGAVEYAHRNLVVHRDLKPGNILVTSAGQAKLLDFGIAKLLGEEVAHQTRTGQRWMTPAYAAPEQIRGEGATTATDVYQLGAVLYELLTGRRPFEPDGGGVRAVEDAVLTKEPTRPSRITESVSGGATDGRVLRGDLDAIVLKALRKEPEQRYGSVEALADDVRRYLAREPVRARQGSRGYRMRRFVARHRMGVAVAAGLVAILAGSATALALEQAATARERDRAAAEAVKATQVTEYLLGLFEASDPGEALGDTVTARQLLERGVARADALTDQPEVQAALLGITGRVYRNLGEYDRGEALLRRAVSILRARPDSDHGELTATLLELAGTLEARESLPDAAEAYAEVIERAARGSGSAAAGQTALFGLGSVLHAQNRMPEADSVFRAWEGSLDSLPRTATEELAQGQVWLGQMLHYRGAHDRSERLLRGAVATQRELYGDVSPSRGYALHALASLLLTRGSVEAADSVTLEALTLHRALNPEPNRALAQSLNYRAELLQHREEYREAERLTREAQAIADTLFGQDHLLWGQITTRLAHVLHLQGRNEEAEELYRGLYATSVEQWGPEYTFTVVMATRLAGVLVARDRFEEAEELLRSCFDIYRRTRGDDDPVTRAAAERLERLYEAWGKPAALPSTSG